MASSTSLWHKSSIPHDHLLNVESKSLVNACASFNLAFDTFLFMHTSVDIQLCASKSIKEINYNIVMMIEKKYWYIEFQS